MGVGRTLWRQGDGRRVKKIVPATNETTIFVYEAAGQLVAEYSTQTSQTATVSYLTNDHLESPRILTDATGAVTSRRDFHPFGEEILTAQRTTGLGYAADTIRQKFTGYERDIESDLDFAQARYFAYNHGRFTSPDPILIKQNKLVDPQRLNLYAYVTNNPFKFVDIFGEDLILANENARKAAQQLFGGVRAGERERIKVLDNGRVSITGGKRRGANSNSSTAFDVISRAVNAKFEIRIHVLKPGESAKLKQAAPDVDTGASIMSFTYDEIVGRAGATVLNDDGSADIYIPEGATILFEGEDGRVNVPTTLLTMTPHELAHAFGLDAVQIENNVRDENGLPRRSGCDHNDGVRPRCSITVAGPEVIDVPQGEVNNQIQPRPLAPPPRRP